MPDDLDLNKFRVVGQAAQSSWLRPAPSIALSDEQKIAHDYIAYENAHSHVFLTGEAGTGKSYLIRALRESIGATVCGTTALAALNVGGTTIDRLFNFDRSDWCIRDRSRLDILMARAAEDIIVDEASMCGEKMSNLILDLAGQYRKRLILVGDLAQASPVKDEWGVRSKLFQDAKLVKLTHVHRQADKEYLHALSMLRSAQIDRTVRDTFAPCVVGNRDDDPAFESYIRMMATNALTDSYNMKRFESAASTSAETRLMAVYTDLRPDKVRSKWPLKDAQVRNALDQTRLANNEWMKIGVRVILTVNDQSELRQYINGDTGIVTNIELTDGTSIRLNATGTQVPNAKVATVTVRLDRGNVEVALIRVTQEYKDAYGGIGYSITGFPLRLGWAHTIHKSQGMTLQRAYVSMPSILHMIGESKHGLAYVALSRTVALGGLAIDRWCDEAVYCSKEVYAYI
jgi:hypothetical protein